MTTPAGTVDTSSWEPFVYPPNRICPVIGEFVRGLLLHIPPSRRPFLEVLLPRLTGSGAGSGRSLVVERQRAYILADFVARKVLPLALDTAAERVPSLLGLGDSFRKLTPVVDRNSAWSVYKIALSVRVVGEDGSVAFGGASVAAYSVQEVAKSIHDADCYAEQFADCYEVVELHCRDLVVRSGTRAALAVAHTVSSAAPGGRGELWGRLMPEILTCVERMLTLPGTDTARYGSPSTQ